MHRNTFICTLRIDVFLSNLVLAETVFKGQLVWTLLEGGRGFQATVVHWQDREVSAAM